MDDPAGRVVEGEAVAADAKTRMRVNRLRIFAAVREYMLRYSESPTARTIAGDLGMPWRTVSWHFLALTNAKGLPFPIASGKERNSVALSRRYGHSLYAKNFTNPERPPRDIADVIK